ncbi:MAG: hypothetical protein F6K31_42065 [Symploca sp. SIO2G7]|nr:hypothetical protein [Symploca sp. SIO2G7]
MADIVIFEDNMSLSLYWRSILEENCHQVRCCSTVSKALELVLEATPELLIADMLIKQDGRFIPEGGITLLHKLAARELITFPVLGVSGYRASSYKSLSALDIAKSMKISLALYKPITPQKLLQTVSKLLNNQRTSPATLND